jgi:hypothetical protein
LRAARASYDLAWEIVWASPASEGLLQDFSRAEATAFTEALSSSVLITDDKVLDTLDDLILSMDKLGNAIRDLPAGESVSSSAALIGDILDLRKKCWHVSDTARYRLHTAAETGHRRLGAERQRRVAQLRARDLTDSNNLAE